MFSAGVDVMGGLMRWGGDAVGRVDAWFCECGGMGVCILLVVW